jgi:tryptophanyl-tRNA synthetase
MIMGPATRVMSLRDGTKKMSKSDESDYSRINMTDDADTIAKKFQKAKSDMEAGITYDEAVRPECSNLINIYSALSGLSREAVLTEFGDKNFSTFKKALADISIEKLSPITGHMRDLMKDTTYIDGILRDGAERANKLAQRYLAEIKEMIGFVRL